MLTDAYTACCHNVLFLVSAVAIPSAAFCIGGSVVEFSSALLLPFWEGRAWPLTQASLSMKADMFLCPHLVVVYCSQIPSHLAKTLHDHLNSPCLKYHSHMNISLHIPHVVLLPTFKLIMTKVGNDTHNESMITPSSKNSKNDRVVVTQLA